MYDAHERILQKLAASGQKEFSAEMIQDAMSKVEEEDLDAIHAQWLKGEEAHNQEEAQWRADEHTIDRIGRSHEDAQMQPTSWEEIEEDLSSFLLPDVSEHLLAALRLGGTLARDVICYFSNRNDSQHPTVLIHI